MPTKRWSGVEWSERLILWRFTCGWLVVGGFSCVVVLLDVQRNVNIYENCAWLWKHIGACLQWFFLGFFSQ